MYTATTDHLLPNSFWNRASFSSSSGDQAPVCREGWRGADELSQATKRRQRYLMMYIGPATTYSHGDRPGRHRYPSQKFDCSPGSKRAIPADTGDLQTPNSADRVTYLHRNAIDERQSRLRGCFPHNERFEEGLAESSNALGPGKGCEALPGDATLSLRMKF